MAGILRRTNTTSLSDNELALLDVMFNGNVPLRLLRRETFAAQWNRSTHGLSDGELCATLDRLCKAGVLRLDSSSSRHVYCMTRKGGRDWERERCPSWNRLTCDRYGEHRSGKPTVSILALSHDVREQFWNAGVECGLFAYTNGRRRSRTIAGYSMIAWRPPTTVFVTVAILDDWWSDTDWPELERRRTWWRSAIESDRFWEERSGEQ